MDAIVYAVHHHFNGEIDLSHYNGQIRVDINLQGFLNMEASGHAGNFSHFQSIYTPGAKWPVSDEVRVIVTDHF